MKKFGLLLAAGALTLGLAACGGAEDEAKTSNNSSEQTTAAASDAEVYTINAKNWDFTPDKELTIKKGTKVQLKLVNEEGMHTISNKDLGIELTADKPAEFTAEEAGEYELICSTVCGAMEDHEAMKVTLKIID